MVACCSSGVQFNCCIKRVTMICLGRALTFIINEKEDSEIPIFLANTFCLTPCRLMISQSTKAKRPDGLDSGSSFNPGIYRPWGKPSPNWLDCSTCRHAGTKNQQGILCKTRAFLTFDST